MKRCIVYARISQNDDNEDNKLEGQIKDCKAYAEQQGYAIIDTIREVVSGAYFHTEGLETIKVKARNKKFDVLVCRNADRLSRDRIKSEILRLELQNYDVAIEFSNEQYDDSAIGKVTRDIAQSFAEYEREMTAWRMNNGRRKAVENGSFLVFGKAPFGLKAAKQGNIYVAEIIEQEAELIRKIYHWYTDDDMSPPQICKHLDKIGVPTISVQRNYARQGKRWRKQSIVNILTDTTYKGVWYYGKRGGKTKQVLENGHYKTKRLSFHHDEDYRIPLEVPAIIAPDYWERTQKVLKRNKNRKKSDGSLKREYLLRQFIKCSCGRVVKGKKNRHRTYYICRSSDKGKIEHCGMPSIRADKLDPICWHWLHTILSDKNELKGRMANLEAEYDKVMKPIEDERDLLYIMHNKAVGKYDKLLELFLDGSIPKDLLEDKRKALENEIEQIEEKIMDNSGDAQHYMQDYHYTVELSNMLEDGTIPLSANSKRSEDDYSLEEKRELFKKFHFHVTLDKDENDQVTAHIQCDLGSYIASLDVKHQLSA